MGRKISPIIIIVIALVVAAIGIFIFSLIRKDGNNIEGKNNVGESIIKPILNLSLNTSEEKQEKVTIIVKANMEDGSNITKIILPDNTEVLSSETTYEVTENGDYSFKAIAENGEEEIGTISVSNIQEFSAFRPYIPEGFKPVRGTEVETGFVIEDNYGNEYVWVPVEKGQLTRETMLDSDYEESNSTALELYNSVAKNYGFYIAKYETSEYELNGEKVAATMAGKIPWVNITFLEATEFANNSSVKFEYADVKTAMLNSFAWDTILKWFDQDIGNYSTSIEYGNYSGSVYPTGSTEKDVINNICDIAGNVREWTTEIYKGQSTITEDGGKIVSRVVRGGSANVARTPKSHTGYPENTYEPYWGFRMVLYK